MSLAADTGGSGPSGTNVARYVPANRTVYVEVGLVDLYTNVAVIGQLSEALHGQYPGLSSTVAAQVAASRAQAAYVATLSPRQALALRQEQARGH
jgi:hypothetical protein